ncbi:hypothetical protein C1645_399062 [Glomus cerebriforme]|uniref:FAD linked oxidase N-terminal domain-containing protein n=1 Tax=Glomus cerebriforme TaxID=658196 RepID=A0A397SJP2_9GLOM|nr:hypothetical protein C1645_399062 [Glomus cerebriforme]
MIRISAFQFFLLIFLSFLLNKVEAISRHRHTFFFEENAFDAFTEDTVQILGKHAVKVRNFSGIREWKVITTPEELLKVVRAACSFGFKVQMTTLASYRNIIFLIVSNTVHHLERKLDITRSNRV